MPIAPKREIYTISQLTAKIKDALEGQFSFVWVVGEITNRYIPASGHYYFDLKDESSSIRAVIFKGQMKNLKFDPENGLEVTGFGRVSVYAPRGTYQIILEYIEPAGAGALQIAFEQLKRRLEKEGLFDKTKKQPLPLLPQTIGVVTSLSGAVIHDMMNVLFRRFENIRLVIAPSKVQGVESENEIAGAIELLNQHAQSEIIVLARGGGSLEDLQAFNSETVARAIYGSRIPVVSAVGHEVDYTISDFTSDFRAPTPSAAAELIVPEKKEVMNKIVKARNDMNQSIRRLINENRNRLETETKMIKNPRRHIDELRLRIDHLTKRLTDRVRYLKSHVHHEFTLVKLRIVNKNPISYIDKYKDKNEIICNNMLININIYMNEKQSRLKRVNSALTTLNPMAVLERGYSITRTVDEKKQRVIMDADQVDLDQHLEILLAKGILRVNVQNAFTTKL